MATSKRRTRGEGSISFHKASGQWMYRASLGKDAAGKRIVITIYARTRTELHRKIFDERARRQKPLNDRPPETAHRLHQR